MLKRLKKTHTNQLGIGFMNICTHKSTQEIYIHIMGENHFIASYTFSFYALFVSYQVTSLFHPIHSFVLSLFVVFNLPFSVLLFVHSFLPALVAFFSSSLFTFLSDFFFLCFLVVVQSL